MDGLCRLELVLDSVYQTWHLDYVVEVLFFLRQFLELGMSCHQHWSFHLFGYHQLWLLLLLHWMRCLRCMRTASNHKQNNVLLPVVQLFSSSGTVLRLHVRQRPCYHTWHRPSWQEPWSLWWHCCVCPCHVQRQHFRLNLGAGPGRPSFCLGCRKNYPWFILLVCCQLLAWVATWSCSLDSCFPLANHLWFLRVVSCHQPL